MSESLSVYGRYVVGLLSVWVRDCRSAVGYESIIVLMIGFQSVSCRLSIGLKSGDSIPNLTRHEPDWFYGVFSSIVGGRQLADSVKNLCFLSVSCRFGRCDWGMRVQLTVNQHWDRWWLGIDQATSHQLNQWWPVDWDIVVVVYWPLGSKQICIS